MGYYIETTIKGVQLRFRTEDGLFSPTKVDHGTLAMLSVVDFSEEGKVLDLGCGYGVVGILAAKLIGPQNVIMVDNDPLAVRLAQENAELNGVPGVSVLRSDGLRQLTETGFTKILSNPPYHSDFSVAKHFVEKGFNRLTLGGQMYLVVKRKEWYKNKLIAIFGGVRIQEIEGYYVLCAEKRCSQYACKKTGI